MLTESHPIKAPSPGVANLVPGRSSRLRRNSAAPATPHRPIHTPLHRDLVVVAPAPAEPTTWAPAGKREVRHLASLLARGEPVKRMAHGSFAKRKGLLVLTSQRVLFMRDRWNGAMAHEFHLASVSAITLHDTGGHSRVSIDCLGKVTEINNVPTADASALVHEAQRILSYVRSPVNAPRPRLVAATDPAPAPAKTASPTPRVDDDASLLMSHLRELAQLRQDGFLDDYEFAVAKSKLLN